MVNTGNFRKFVHSQNLINMSQYLVRYRIKNHSATLEVTVTAPNFASAKKIVEAQNGSGLDRIVSVNEQR